MADTARADGRVDVADLAARFDVTAETVRRDLTELEARGVVRRVHGGAIPVERFRSEPEVSEKARLRATEKSRIAKAALAYVPQAGSILLDAGTTTAALASLLPDRTDLTVVTNALPVALTLAARPNLDVLVVGGRLRGRTLANVGDWTMRALRDLSVDVAFVGTNGVSVERGLSTPDSAEAAAKRAMVAAGRQVVLLADHSKIGQEHFERFASIDEIDVFVTDGGIPPQHAEHFERAVGELVVA